MRETAARFTDFIQPITFVSPATRRGLILIACLVATFMAAIEGTIVATAMPAIAGDLGGFDQFSGVFTAFLITQAVSIPIYGRLADMWGRKTVFFIGTGLFLTGSVLCGMAHGITGLILFRAIQGLGAGAVQPVAATILGDIYTPAERARVQGLISCVFGVSAVAGPALGAFLTQIVPWPWIFWISLPFGIAAAILIGAFLSETATPRPRAINATRPGAIDATRPGAIDAPRPGAIDAPRPGAIDAPRPGAIDAMGAWLMLMTAGDLTLALSGMEDVTPILLASGLASAGLLWVHERDTPEPMLPLDLWRRNRVVVVGSLGSCAAGAVFMGVLAFLPAYVTAGMGNTAMAGGLVIGGLQVSWALASLYAARLMTRVSYRQVAITGAAALCAGAGLLIVAPPIPFWTEAAALCIGTGMGLTISVFVVSTQAAVTWEERGAATGSLMFLRFMGQAAGAAGCGAILALDGDASLAMNRLMQPAGLLTPETAGRLSIIVADSLHNAWYLVGVLAFVTLLLASMMPARINTVTR